MSGADPAVKPLPQPVMLAGIYLMPDGSAKIVNSAAARARQIPMLLVATLGTADGNVIVTSELPPKETSHALIGALNSAVGAIQVAPPSPIIQQGPALATAESVG